MSGASASSFSRRFPDSNERLTFGATPMLDLLVGEARGPLLVLFGAVALVLLVACANVASLLLARGSSRRGELAVRAALGAGRGRLVRQLVAEAIVLGLFGGAMGVLLAYVAVRTLVWAQPADIPATRRRRRQRDGRRSSLSRAPSHGAGVRHHPGAPIDRTRLTAVRQCERTGRRWRWSSPAWRAGGGRDDACRRVAGGGRAADPKFRRACASRSGVHPRSCRVVAGHVAGPQHSPTPRSSRPRAGTRRPPADTSWCDDRCGHQRTALERARIDAELSGSRRAAAAGQRQRGDCRSGHHARVRARGRHIVAARARSHGR